MTRGDREILVLEDDILLGQLLCDMIRMHRIGSPHLSTSEVDACQMMGSHKFDLCIVDASLRGEVCHRAVAMANQNALPMLLLTDGNDASELNLAPTECRIVRKPASEEDIRLAAVELLGNEAVR